MILTSEVENILNGQLESKTENLKAIGVSTANLLPDQNGEVPLSKQGAFSIKNSTSEVQSEVPSTQPVATPSQVETTPSNLVEPIAAVSTETPVSAQPTTMPVEPVTVQTPVVETPPVANAPVAAPLVEEVPASIVAENSVENPLDDPQISALNALKEATANEELESINYDKAGDVLLSSPVDVASPDSLESFSFGAGKDETPVVEKTPVVSAPVSQAEKVELPQMPTEIIGQEPIGVNESLFADNKVASDIPSPVVESTDGQLASDNVEMINVASDIESSKGPETTVVSEQVVDSPFTVPTIESNSMIPNTENLPTEDALPKEDNQTVLSVPQPDVVPGLDAMTDLSSPIENNSSITLEKPKVESSDSAPSSPASLFDQELIEEEKSQDNLYNKLDQVLSDLSEVKEAIKNLRVIIEKNNKEEITNGEVIELDKDKKNDIEQLEKGIPSLSEIDLNVPKSDSTIPSVLEDNKLINEIPLEQTQAVSLPTLEESLVEPSVSSQPVSQNVSDNNTMQVSDEQIVASKGYFV